MTSKGTDHFDDDGFDAFLHGQDDLSRHLRSLAQPEPSAKLDAAIMAAVQADLVQAESAPSAANDPTIPGACAPRPGFLTRWRPTLALAACVLLAVLVLLRWQSQPNDSAAPVLAQSQQEAAPSVAAAPAQTLPAPTSQPSTPEKPGATRLAARTPAVGTNRPTGLAAASALPDSNAAGTISEGGGSAEPTVQIAQAEPQEYSQRAAATPAPVPAAAAAAAPRPSVADTTVTPSANSEKAKAWIALIDELLKADLRQDALAEWEKFRQAYPHYPVPEKLAAQIKALKKH